VNPTIEHIAKKNLLYRGILYFGIMVTKTGPTLLEYNIRFGDPEAQVVLPLLDGDWGEVFLSLAKGELIELNWKPIYCTCVVIAAKGYPEHPELGVIIEGNPKKQTPSTYFLHSGTKISDEGEWVTNGGRVLNAIGIGSSMDEAVEKAYEQVESVHWEGYQFRKDIGKGILKQ